MAAWNSLTCRCSDWKILIVLNEVLMQQLSIYIVFSQYRIKYKPMTYASDGFLTQFHHLKEERVLHSLKGNSTGFSPSPWLLCSVDGRCLPKWIKPLYVPIQHLCNQIRTTQNKCLGGFFGGGGGVESKRERLVVNCMPTFGLSMDLQTPNIHIQAILVKLLSTFCVV